MGGRKKPSPIFLFFENCFAKLKMYLGISRKDRRGCDLYSDLSP